MGLITLSRQYGSDGRSVGLKVAELLNYHHVNKEIISQVAEEANKMPGVVGQVQALGRVG